MFSLCCLLVLVCPAIAQIDFTPVVETTTGPIRGAILTYGGNTVHRYLGIPYAVPPLGKLRFAAPKPAQPWTKTLDAVEYGNRCIQDPATDELFYGRRVPPPTGEDCLHLTIVSPQSDTIEQKAVMLYIHGGGLNLGSSADFPTEALAIAGDVVLVSINYRLNIFGFLASEDDSAPGNVGFWDQRLAMQWVKDNIAEFGGDPERITIFGESAGGWSVSAHMVSPQSAGLFTRAISQSGTLYGFKLDSIRDRIELLNKWAKEFDCALTSQRVILECLKSQDPQKLFDVSYYDLEMSNPAIIGDKFLPETPKQLFDDGKIQPDVDYIIGTTSDEGAMLLTMLIDPASLNDTLTNGIEFGDPIMIQMREFLMAFKGFGDSPIADTIRSIFANRYIKDEDDRIANLRRPLDALSEAFFIAPSLGTANAVAKAGNNVYYYWFDQVSKIVLFSDDAALPQPNTIKGSNVKFGASHGSDLFYTFAHSLVEDVPMSYVDEMPFEDKQISQSIVYSWTTFAKTGKAEYLSDNGGSEDWPKFTPEDEDYLVWKYPMTSSSVEQRLLPGVNDFWNKLLPAFVDKGKTRVEKKRVCFCFSNTWLTLPLCCMNEI